MNDVDDLAQFIRQVDGNHTMGAGALAEAIVAYQLEALLADDVIERAARALFYGDVDPDLDVTWTTAHEGVRAEYLAMASNALAAALGEDEK